jgi:MFS family permease
MQDKNFGIQTTTVMATTLAFFALVAKPIWGIFAEKIHIRWVMVLAFILSGISLMLLVWAQNVPMLLGYAAFHGLTMGGEATLMNVALATYFGRDHMGAIRGAVAPIGVIMGSLSPVISGWLWTPETSYDLPFIMLSAIWVIAGLIMLLAKPPAIPEIPT